MAPMSGKKSKSRSQTEGKTLNKWVGGEEKHVGNLEKIIEKMYVKMQEFMAEQMEKNQKRNSGE